jgi:TonB family protein
MSDDNGIPRSGFDPGSRKQSSWADRFACWTIRQAARRTPLPLSERLEEEWLADLESRRDALSRLLLGIGCCWAAAVIANEQFAASAATASTTGRKTMAHTLREDSSFLSPRATALIIIAGLHLFLFYAFASGFGPRVFSALPPDMVVTTTREVIKRDPPPPMPGPELTNETVTAFKPTDIKLDPPPDTESIQEVISEPLPPQPLPPQTDPKPVNRVMGGTGKGFPDSRDFYPSASIRLNETGSATIHVCVDGSGRLTGDPTVVKTSGFTRLDEGALKLARAGSGHYRPTTEDGRPVSSCYPLLITFHLTN